MQAIKVQRPRARWYRRFAERLLSEGAFERLRVYSWKVRAENWYIGKYVELTGNKVDFRGLKLALDNPAIDTRSKSFLYFQAHENTEIELSQQFLDRTLPTVELGASIGVMACVTNAWLGRTEDHVVVEANPTIVHSLLKNRRLNGCRFKVIAAAVGSREPFVEFSIDVDFLKSRLKDGGEQTVLVPTVRLGDILERYGFETINLQVDVEGAELFIVDDELETIRKHVKWLVMETHARYVGEEGTERMLKQLEGAGFERIALDPDPDVVVVFRNRAMADS